MILGIERHFDAAHRLPGYKGKCSQTHGHTWIVRVEIQAKRCTAAGMVMDLRELGRILDKVIDKLDHNLLNDHLSQPTCENLCVHIWQGIHADITFYPKNELEIKSIQVQEGIGGWARKEKQQHS